MLFRSVKKTLDAHHFPIVLSGDHSSALGTISGVKAAFPDKTLGVVWIDAHADLHSPYTSPSGNIHGMPVAAAIGHDNMDCQINEVGRATEKSWNAMKNLGTKGAKVLPQNVVYFGVRDTEEPEDRQMSKLAMRNYIVAEVRYRGIDICVQEVLESLSDCDMIYISFDVDSMDCDMISYGTGTPVPKGFDPCEIMSIINRIVQSNKVVCLELVEINPLLDLKGNKMAETAFEVLDNVTKGLLDVLSKG